MKSFLVMIIILTSLAASAQELSTEFSQALKRYKISNIGEQSFCYSQNGVTEGYRPESLQRIASITKLFSTLLASETMNLNGVFTTKIYIAGDRMHIEGGRDPYIEEEKLLLLFQALNGLNYRSFKSITINDQFLFYDLGLGEYAKITTEMIRARLAFYTNSKNKKFLASKWASVRKFAAEEGVELSNVVPQISSTSVTVSNVNPLLNLKPKVLVHKSLPFHRILKSMNVQSKNIVAENVYDHSSMYKKLDLLLIENDINPETFKIYNGSGLPIVSKKSRLDNLATCDTLLKVFELLRESLRKHNLELTDVIAVNGGKDLGSFRNRFRTYPELDDAVISKTGTLKHTSSLGGFIMAGSEVPFAILNHTTSTGVAKDFQDYFVSKLFEYLGDPMPLPYEKISIFPWSSLPFFLP